MVVYSLLHETPVAAAKSCKSLYTYTQCHSFVEVVQQQVQELRGDFRKIPSRRLRQSIQVPGLDAVDAAPGPDLPSLSTLHRVLESVSRQTLLWRMPSVVL